MFPFRNYPGQMSRSQHFDYRAPPNGMAPRPGETSLDRRVVATPAPLSACILPVINRRAALRRPVSLNG
jgi:hypothetical protein